MGIGLKIEFDGKRNIVIFGDGKEYPIGGLICEYARLRPTEIKDIIIQNPYYHELFDLNIVSEALSQFYNDALVKFDVVTSEIMTCEFTDYISQFYNCEEEYNQMLITLNSDVEKDEIKQFILENSGFTTFGIETVGQAMLTAYYTYSYSFIAFKKLFENFVTDTYKDHEMNALLRLFSENISYQHINFCIGLYDGALHSIYTIESSLSLIIFEIAHVLSNDVKIKKCKNCNQYFVPIGRSDSIYCGYPSPQDASKACRDIGARNSRVRKLKEDAITSEYRKIYMRLTMRVVRNQDVIAEEKLKELKKEMARMREMKKKGLISSDSILEWLNSMDYQN